MGIFNNDTKYNNKLINKINNISEENNRKMFEFDNEIFTIKDIHRWEESKILSVEMSLDKHENLPIWFKMMLTHSWYYSNLEKEDQIRVIGKFTEKNKFWLKFDDLSSNEESYEEKGRFFILEPELLITSTDISIASPWPRVPILKNMYWNWEKQPKFPLIFGNIVHLVFQKMLATNDHREYTIEKIIKESIEDQLLNLYLIKDTLSEKDVIVRVREAVVKILNWIQTISNPSENELNIKLQKQIAVEQEVHCDFYGVKGKIDSTVTWVNSNNIQEVYPLELKTGKYKSSSHRGQVLIYSLVLPSIFKILSNNSFLLYIMLDHGQLDIIKRIDIEIKPLIQNRNVLARYYKNRLTNCSSLPPIHRHPSECNRWFSKKVWAWNAFAFSEKTSEGINPEFSEFLKLESKLPSSTKNYFTEWITAINLEQEADENLTKNEYTKLYYKNPKIKKWQMMNCMPKGNGIILTLRKIIPLEYSNYDPIESLTVGDNLLISPTNSILWFTKGILLKKSFYSKNSENKWIRHDQIARKIQGDLEIIVEFESTDFQNLLPEALGGLKWMQIGWIVQKEILTNTRYANMRGNIYKIWAKTKYEEHRKFLIHNDYNEWEDFDNFDEKLLEIKKKYKFILNRLNDLEKIALWKSIHWKYYHIVFGGPASGKNTLIVNLAYILNDMQKKVLIVSNTNQMLQYILNNIANNIVNKNRKIYKLTQLKY